MLEFAGFRADAVPLRGVAVGPDWAREEQALRRTAARLSYQRGAAAFESRRPKRANLRFSDADRFVPSYRDAGKLADRERSRVHCARGGPDASGRSLPSGLYVLALVAGGRRETRRIVVTR